MSSKTRDSASAMLAALISFGPMTMAELSALSALSESSVSAWLASLKKANLVHIAGWRVTPGRHSALYAWNPGFKDVPLLAKTSQQRVQAHRSRQKAATA